MVMIMIKYNGKDDDDDNNINEKLCEFQNAMQEKEIENTKHKETYLLARS